MKSRRLDRSIGTILIVLGVSSTVPGCAESSFARYYEVDCFERFGDVPGLIRKQAGDPCDVDEDSDCDCVDNATEKNCSPDLSGDQNKYPDGPEIVGNNQDDNCNGQIDELSENSCTPGDSETCFPYSVKPIGECNNGFRLCNAMGQWGPCLEAVGPNPEICNYKDDDCDGVIDDNVEGSGDPCVTNLPGICKQGTRRCDNGILECIATTTAGSVAEQCNGLDDDCDGQIDEGLTNACGKCGALPAESCNAIDDDCDGKIDEALPNCGLALNCTWFNLNTAPSSATTFSPGIASGSEWKPIIEIRSVQSAQDIDGGYAFQANSPSGTFNYFPSNGNTSTTISGRVCTLGVGATTTGIVRSHLVTGGSSISFYGPSPAANSYQATTAWYAMITGDQSPNDNNFEYVSTAAGSDFTLTASDGDSTNKFYGAFTRLSLPTGYKVNIQSFNVTNGSSKTLYFTDDPVLGVNEFFTSVLTYKTCGADRFGYNVTCNATSCTITASNGSSCSYVSGYITQLQWVDNI